MQIRSITVMLNLTLLRRHQPIVLMSEYLRLHQLRESVEANDGRWDRILYHDNIPSLRYDHQNAIQKPSLSVIENGEYDPNPYKTWPITSTRCRAYCPQSYNTNGKWRFSPGGKLSIPLFLQAGLIAESLLQVCWRDGMEGDNQ